METIELFEIKASMPYPRDSICFSPEDTFKGFAKNIRELTLTMLRSDLWVDGRTSKTSKILKASRESTNMYNMSLHPVWFTVHSNNTSAYGTIFGL